MVPKQSLELKAVSAVSQACRSLAPLMPVVHYNISPLALSTVTKLFFLIETTASGLDGEGKSSVVLSGAAPWGATRNRWERWFGG